jgi:hypothetical protein
MRPPSPARLAAFLLGSAVAVNATLLASGVPAHQTLVQPLEFFASFRQGSDSWRPMVRAHHFASTPEGRSRTLYQKLFFSPMVRHKGFQYPPTALVFVAAANLFGDAKRVFEVINWLFVPGLAVACAWIYRLTLARVGFAPLPPGWVLLLCAACATLTFFPAMQAYRAGQIQAWLNGLFGISLGLWLLGRERLAGGLLGLSALIKPQWGMLLLWGLVRRRFGFALAFAATLAAGTLVSIALFGLAPHLEYLDVMRYIAERGESFYANQSMNGILNRWFGTGLNLTWMEHFPTPHPAVRIGTHLAALALLGLTLWPPRRGAGSALDMAVMAIALTAASPIAWEHHYGMLLPAFALAFAIVGGSAAPPRGRWWLLIGSYLLASHSWRFADRLADTRWNVLQAYLFFGALGLMALLLWLSARATIPSSGARAASSQGT